jgi:NADH-quinone oxidoreductase subunit M
MSGTPLLSLAIWVPILAGFVVLATGSDRNAPLARMLSLIGAVAGLLVTIPLYTGFDMRTPAMQFVELATWIPRFNVNYHLGVDGISMPFVILNSFITVTVVLAGWQVIDNKVAQYNAGFLIMSGLLNGIFSALDGVLFYVFFEASLIPLYLIIGIWGGPNRVYAAFKFFLFTLFGSLLFLLALLYLFINSGGSFAILDWHQLPIGMSAQTWLFLAFLVAFAVKVPMWPVHTWLPDAHVEAPTGGSIVLAAIALKLGAYGFLRFSLPIAPDASHELSGLVIALSLIAIIYIGFVALVQEDMKKLVAYSSIAHMGFVTLGFFMFSAMGIEGALVQMISHGFVSGAMFFAIGVMYDRAHSRQIADYGGVVNTMPNLPPSSCFLPWPTPACRRPRALSASSWSSSRRSITISGWLRRCLDDDRRCRLHPVDVQARGVWLRWPITTSPNSPTSTPASSSFSSSSPLARWAWVFIPNRLLKSCTARSMSCCVTSPSARSNNW